MATAPKRSGRMKPREAAGAIATLAVALELDAGLPTEFRLFVAGWNETEKGAFLFDEAAAASVMDHQAAWGVDLMIDLEHQALDPFTPADPTARDARGWCNLEVRGDGSLWAVNVRWTPDGAARLSEKRQRYVSPAFAFDDSRRITQLVNVALTALPATHQTPALVAARAVTTGGRPTAALGGLGMDPKLVKEALDALIKGDAKAALDILQNLVVSAAGGDPDASTEDAPPPVGDGGADETTEMAAAPPPAAPPAGPTEDPKKAMAAARLACAITGETDVGRAMLELSRRSKLAIELEEREAKLAADRASLEISERRSIVAEMVKLGVETPATAWADDKATTPAEHLAAMPIERLRTRLAQLKTNRSGTRHEVRPPASNTSGAGTGAAKTFETPVGPVELSARELRFCEEAGAKPEEYAANKAELERRRARNRGGE